ncbi:MAG: hypothetical protein U9N03_07760 [Candidatus Caldatribacteriota bacterium]|nr:hypothetical protein [Candidatus Caldatribacteriota bacterium]
MRGEKTEDRSQEPGARSQEKKDSIDYIVKKIKNISCGLQISSYKLRNKIPRKMRDIKKAASCK